MEQIAVRTLFASAVLFLALVPANTGETTEEPEELAARMARGKLETDLADYEEASRAFASIADDESAPVAMRWEALVRLGLARSAAGDSPGSTDAFRRVTAEHSDDPEAVRFLMSALAGTVPGRIWIDLEAQFEELLRSAEVVSVEDLVMGRSGPKRVYLVKDDVELRAIFKQDNYRAGIAAYEMDKVLGLSMVPPTVERTIGSDNGLLQLWVEGCKVYKDVQAKSLPEPNWSHQLSRMRTFDSLIGNRDRNVMNILLDPGWGAVLVDHNRSFGTHLELSNLPDQFDRGLAERLEALDREGLLKRFRGLLSGEQVDSILDRRDALLDHLEKLVAERGEARVLF